MENGCYWLPFVAGIASRGTRSEQSEGFRILHLTSRTMGNDRVRNFTNKAPEIVKIVPFMHRGVPFVPEGRMVDLQICWQFCQK